MRNRLSFMRGKRLVNRLVGKALLALAIVLFLIAGKVYLARAAPSAQTASDGQAIFTQKCTACHTIGGGVRVGPDLKGVTTRRTTAWLTNWLLGPDKMLAAKDPTAIQLLQQYNNVQMPNFNFTSVQVASLIAYLTSQDTASQATGTQPAGGQTAASQPAAPLLPGDAVRGKAYFTAVYRLQNGGPACIACHSVAGIGGLGGGTLGPDLTGAYTKYGGDVGLANFLATTPTLTMSAVWTRQPFNPQEQADLRVFLQQAATAGLPVQPLGILIGIAGVGLVVLLAVAQIYWRKRLISVRKPMLREQNLH